MVPIIVQNNFSLRIPLMIFISNLFVVNMVKSCQRTKVLKIIVSFTPASRLNLKYMVNKVMMGYRACPTMFLHMMLVINGSSLLTDGSCLSSSAGSSIVIARAANAPTINFTHSIWSVACGTLPAEMAATILIFGGCLAEIAVTKSITRDAMLTL